MQTYVQQLVEDIKAGRHIDDPKEVQMSFEEEMERLEGWATGTALPVSLAQQTGLNKNQFPPVNQLDEKQQLLIVNTLVDVFESWHHRVELPDEMPAPLKYDLIQSVLDEQGTYFPNGFICHNFCDGHAPGCVLGEYCRCKEYWEDEELKI